jgi:hypothetical protein
MMYFCWRGKGWIAPEILFGFPYGIRWIFQKITGDIAVRPDGLDAHLWPILLGQVLAGLFLFVWGRNLNNRPAQRAIERATGREILVRPNHGMYGVKVEYWGIVSVAGAGILWGWGDSNAQLILK